MVKLVGMELATVGVPEMTQFVPCELSTNPFGKFPVRVQVTDLDGPMVARVTL